MSGEAVRVPNNPQSHIMNYYVSDEDQLQVMRYRLVQGRFFSKEFPSDSNAVVINEAAFRDLGWTDLEHKELAADGDTRYKVIGVINDFNYESLRSDIKPMLIFFNPNPGSTLTLRFNNTEIHWLISKLETIWKQFSNGEPFDYQFISEDFEALFALESRVGILLTVFSGGIIIIACLGLFALSSFTIEKRGIEIGIRKIMGASISNIASLLLTQVIKLIAISFLLAIVPALLLSLKWLQGFSFRHELTPFPFLIALACVTLIALLTATFHTFKAAFINPVDTIKCE